MSQIVENALFRTVESFKNFQMQIVFVVQNTCLVKFFEDPIRVVDFT